MSTDNPEPLEQDETPKRPEKWDRPLSSAEEYAITLPNGFTVRFDAMNRMLCNAQRRDKSLCKSPAMTGMKVCRMHGAKAPQAQEAARIKFADMAAPAMAKTFQLMMNGDSHSIQLRAASSILDRTGYGRQQVVEAGDAKQLLYQRLLAMQAPADYETPDEEEES